MNKAVKILICVICAWLSLSKWVLANEKEPENLIKTLNDALTEAIVFDGFSPPLASRIYAYSNLAIYESVYFTDKALGSMSGRLNGYSYSELSASRLSGLNAQVSAVVAFKQVAAALVFREFIISNTCDSLLRILSTVCSPEIYEKSATRGDSIARCVLKLIASDRYKETRNMPRFTTGNQWWNWQPTAPVYGEALEPHFSKINSLVSDTSKFFKVKNHNLGSSFDTTSALYQESLTTYKYRNSIDSNHINIAKFWDCNPQKTVIKGHLMYNIRQLTPGGHWVWIGLHCCQIKKLSLARTAEVMALTSIAVFEGFLNCWHEKYRTNLIRPETLIQKYIDNQWQPALETPLFPEHPSGHSVVSAAAAEVLIHYLGDTLTYVDQSEIPFGLPSRRYNSFSEAAREAAMSRVYGGIHYPLASSEGLILGKKIGTLVLEKLAH